METKEMLGDNKKEGASKKCKIGKMSFMDGPFNEQAKNLLNLGCNYLAYIILNQIYSKSLAI